MHAHIYVDSDMSYRSALAFSKSGQNFKVVSAKEFSIVETSFFSKTIFFHLHLIEITLGQLNVN